MTREKKANGPEGEHLEGLAQEYGTTPDVLAKRLSEGLSKDIAARVIALDDMEDKNSEEALEAQKALKANLVEKFQKEPRIHESLRRADITNWRYENAREGVIKCDDVAIKLQRNRGRLKAHEVHKIKAWDAHYFGIKHPELGIQVAPIFDLWSDDAEGYLTLDNVLAGEEKVTIFPQAQEYVQGNNLGEIFHLLPRTLTHEQRKRVKGVIRKLFRDLFLFQQHAQYPKHIVEQIGPRLDLNVESINRYKIETLEHAVTAAGELTDAVTAEEEKAAKEFSGIIYRLLPTAKKNFKRKLDITPWNTMLRHDLGELTPKNIAAIFTYLIPKNIVHVDTGVNYDHVAEEVHNIGDSASFSNVQFGESNIFGPGNSRARRAYLHNRGYDVSEFEDELIGFLRLMRVRYHTMTRFLRRHLELRGDSEEGKKGIEYHRGAMHYRDQAAVDHLGNLARLSAEQGNRDAERAFGFYEGLVRKMSDFSMGTLVERLKKQ